MTLLKRLKSRTPDKWLKVGQAISHLGTMLQVALAGAEASGAAHIPGNYFFWVIGIAVTQWLGSTIVNFATEDNDIDTIKNTRV